MVTIDDLRKGKRPSIFEGELAGLIGCSLSKLQKDRLHRRGLPFRKDMETGRITYDAEDVIAYLARPKFTATCQYDTTILSNRLEGARLAKKQRVGNERRS